MSDGRWPVVAAESATLGALWGISSWSFGASLWFAVLYSAQLALFVALVLRPGGSWYERRRLGVSVAEHRTLTAAVRTGEVPRDDRLLGALEVLVRRRDADARAAQVLPVFLAVVATLAGVALRSAFAPWRTILGVAAGWGLATGFIMMIRVERRRMRTARERLAARAGDVG